MLSIKQISLLLGVASMTLASPIEQNTIVALNTTVVNAPGYILTCNNENLSEYDILQCRDYMISRGGGCNVNGGGAHWCEHGGIKISGVPYGVTSTGAPCSEAADTVQEIVNVCHQRGGSAQVGGNGGLIVHVTSGWVG